MEYWKKAAIVGALGAWSDTMDVFAALLVIGTAAVEWGVGPGLVGLAMTLSRVVAVPVYSAFSGLVIDLFGRKKLFCFGNILAGIAYLGMAYSTNIWMWTAFSVPMIWSFFTTGAASIFVQEELPAEKRGYYFGLTRMMTAVGALSVSLSAPIFAALGWGWRPILLYNAIFDFFVGILGAIVLRESRVWIERRELMRQGKIAKEERLPLRKVISDPSIRKRFFVLSWVMFFLTFTRVPDWFRTPYQAMTLGFDLSTIGYIAIAGTLMGLISTPLFGRLSDIIGRVKVIIISLIMCVVLSALWFMTDILVGKGPTLPVILYFGSLIAVWSLFFAAAGAFISLWQSELYPTSMRATLYTWNYLFYTPPDILLPSVAGSLGEQFGSIGYVAISSIGILAVIPVIIFHKELETKGVEITAN